MSRPALRRLAATVLVSVGLAGSLVAGSGTAAADSIDRSGGSTDCVIADCYSFTEMLLIAFGSVEPCNGVCWDIPVIPAAQ